MLRRILFWYTILSAFLKGEQIPSGAFLIEFRNPTQAEINYGKTLESAAILFLNQE